MIRSLIHQICIGVCVGMALVLMGSSVALSETYPPLKENLTLPAVTVLDEHDQERILGGLDEPLFLLPVFTKCKMSCPILVQALKGALESYAREGGKQSYRVLVFTFDASDRREDLLRFRRDQGIPPSWVLVRSPDQGAIRAFFDSFSYSIMSSDGGFIHPNEIFVFNADGVWISTLFGSGLRSSDIREVFRASLDSQSRGLLGGAKRWLSHPQSWAILGALGLVGTLGFLFSFLVLRKRPGPPSSLNQEAV